MKSVIYVLLVFGYSAHTRDVCSPKIKPHNSLFIYRKSHVRDVRVYNCQFKEVITHYDCQNGGFGGDTSKEYTDFASGCVKSKNHFIDKYNKPYIMKYNETYQSFQRVYNCANKTPSEGIYTYTIVWEYTARADLAKNEIELPFGTRCEYTPGFCFDNKTNADFVWDVETDEDLDCKKLLKIPLKDENSFFLTLNHTYLISEVDQGFAALELIEGNRKLCATYSEHDQLSMENNDIYVSVHNIKEAIDTGELKREDYTVYFHRKQELYDFLARKCHASTRCDHDRVLKSSVEAKIVGARAQFNVLRLEKQLESSKALKEALGNLRDRLRWVIVVVTVLTCGLGFIFIFIFYKLWTDVVGNCLKKNTL